MTIYDVVGWQGLLIFALVVSVINSIIRERAYRQGHKDGFDKGVNARIHYVKRKIQKGK